MIPLQKGNFRVKKTVETVHNRFFMILHNNAYLNDTCQAPD